MFSCPASRWLPLRPAHRAARRHRRPSARCAPSAALALAFLATGCSLIGSYRTGPEGQSGYDTELRALVRQGDFDEALKRTDEDHEDDIGDELLRLLHRGLLQHYAGQYEQSNATLQAAEALVDERYTRSISVALLSLVTSDRALVYLPSRTERLMLYYYGALNYLALGELDEAAVEARRLSGLLERLMEVPTGPSEASVRRTLRYFAGSVFEAAAETNDAAVAYRHVWPERDRDAEARGEVVVQAVPVDGGDARPVAAADSVLWPALLHAGTAAARARSGLGEVVVFLESGFVAHRVERSVTIPLYTEEASALTDTDADVRFAAASCVAARGFGDVWDFARLEGYETRPWETGPDGRCLVRGARRRGDVDVDELYVMRIAWPEMWRASYLSPWSPAWGALAVVTPAAAPPPDERPTDPVFDGPRRRSTRAGSGLVADVSGSVTEEFEGQLGSILVKTVARTAAKYATVKAVEDLVEKEDETLADILGIVANAAVALLERADTRSWHLLPSDLSVTRLRLPAGRYALSVVPDRQSRGIGRLDLGEITVRPGRVHVLGTRSWP